VLLRDPARAGWTSARLAPLLDAAGELALVLDCGADGLSALEALQERAGVPRGGLLIDPLGELAARGGDGELAPAWDGLARALGLPAPAEVRLASLSTLPVDEAGAETATGLAWLLAAGAELLRAMDTRGISPAAVAQRLELTVGVGSDQLVGLARLRAVRRLWARLLQACGLSPVESRVRVHARQLARGLSRRDPWTNLLRGTMAGFVGAVGGADSVTVLPFDHALGRSDALGLRLATNTQLLLSMESHLGATVDPCHGAWSFEALTEELCAAAWQRFQELEAAGGARAVLVSGALRERVGAEAARRQKRIGSRKDVLVGVSSFVDLGAAPLERPPAAVLAPRPGPVAALAPVRDAAPWEGLQAAGQGSDESVFLACWGPLRAHKARADWVANLVQAAGLPAVTGPAGADPTAILAAFATSGARAAVICAPDAAAAEALATLEGPLVAAGARWIGVAGRALADQTDRPLIYEGCAALDEMLALHTALELRP
jgi:methylmalonyl-CoA mutase